MKDDFYQYLVLIKKILCLTCFINNCSYTATFPSVILCIFSLAWIYLTQVGVREALVSIVSTTLKLTYKEADYTLRECENKSMLPALKKAIEKSKLVHILYTKGIVDLHPSKHV